MDKEYKYMNADELDQAKYALESKRAKLKEQYRTAKDEDKESAHQEIKTLRAEMLIIQSWQDRLPKPKRDPNAPVYTLGLKGIASTSEILPKRKKKQEK